MAHRVHVVRKQAHSSWRTSNAVRQIQSAGIPRHGYMFRPPFAPSYSDVVRPVYFSGIWAERHCLVSVASSVVGVIHPVPTAAIQPRTVKAFNHTIGLFLVDVVSCHGIFPFRPQVHLHWALLHVQPWSHHLHLVEHFHKSSSNKSFQAMRDTPSSYSEGSGSARLNSLLDCSHRDFCPRNSSSVSMRGRDFTFQLPPPRSPISFHPAPRNDAPPSAGRV